MEQETLRAEQRIERAKRTMEQAHDSSADAKQTKSREEEMKEGTCQLMSAQTQTPLPRLDPLRKLEASPFYFFSHSPHRLFFFTEGVFNTGVSGSKANICHLKSHAFAESGVLFDQTGGIFKMLARHNGRSI